MYTKVKTCSRQCRKFSNEILALMKMKCVSRVQRLIQRKHGNTQRAGACWMHHGLHCCTCRCANCSLNLMLFQTEVAIFQPMSASTNYTQRAVKCIDICKVHLLLQLSKLSNDCNLSFLKLRITDRRGLLSSIC